jgi:hypothetical protein
LKYIHGGTEKGEVPKKYFSEERPVQGAYADGLWGQIKINMLLSRVSQMGKRRQSLRVQN